MIDRNPEESLSPEELSRRRDEAVKRALATPPISNETIVKRSKESQGK